MPPILPNPGLDPAGLSGPLGALHGGGNEFALSFGEALDDILELRSRAWWEGPPREWPGWVLGWACVGGGPRRCNS